MIIDWDCKPGYGDIISPICYAANQASEKETDVTLKFHFKDRGRFDRHPQEYPCADFLEDRIEFIAKYTTPSKGSVDIQYCYRSDLGKPHTNYPESPKKTNPWHNFRLADYSMRWGNRKKVTDIVSIVSPADNWIVEVPQGKQWKMEGVHNWYDFENGVCEGGGYPVAILDYKTPIEELVEILQRSYFCFSYHGSVAWVARWLGVPMCVISGKPEWSAWNFPTSQTINYIEHHDGVGWKHDIPRWHDRCRENLAEYQQT